HEPFAAYQLFADKESPYQHTFVLGYTNGCENYVATADAYKMGARGGYEASPLGAAFTYFHRLACKPEVEQQIKDGIVTVFKKLQSA
ncbi:MAG: hypothetical protein O3B95_13155, partial [Chloroflexi bacterium]|nr:hypothetical protein [Chloroflexota bacterium]